MKFLHNGIWKEWDRPAGLGDRIERAIGKIPGFKRLPCYENGKLKPESGCGKRKAWLNSLSSQAGPPPAKA